MTMPPNFYSEDDHNNDNEEIQKKKERVNELEGKLSELETKYYNRQYGNHTITNISKVDENITYEERRKQHKDSPINRKSVNREVKGILSKKQLIFLGIGITILLLFMTGSLTQTNNDLSIPQLKLPEWKLPLPCTNCSHIKQDIDWLVATQGKMDWNKHKYNDNQEQIMAKLINRQVIIDKMNCEELINYVKTNTAAALRAYSAHIIIEKGCIIP